MLTQMLQPLNHHLQRQFMIKMFPYIYIKWFSNFFSLEYINLCSLDVKGKISSDRPILPTIYSHRR